MTGRVWDPDRPPPPIMPVPADLLPSIVGQRAIVGEPGRGFRNDARVMSEVSVNPDGVRFVEVLSEHDYFRQLLTGIRLPKIGWGVGQVWIEQRGGQVEVTGRPVLTLEDELADLLAASPASQPSYDERPRHISSGERLVTLDEPPMIRPRRADHVMRLTGLRAAFSTSEGFSYGYRIVSEVFQRDGEFQVTLLEEQEWYSWLLAVEHHASFLRVPVFQVWVE